MKYLVETTGDFMLIDFSVNAEIHHDRPTVVIPTAFVSAAAARGQLKLLRTGLPDEADDKEFEAYWREDASIAIDAFMSCFDLEAVSAKIQAPPPEPEPAPKPARKPRRKSE